MHQMKSYLNLRILIVKHYEEYSKPKDIKSGVTRVNVRRSVLDLLYTRNISTTRNITTVTFIDSSALLTVTKDFLSVTQKL